LMSGAALQSVAVRKDDPKATFRSLGIAHDFLQDALAMKGALSSVQEVSKSINRTLEAGNAYQRVQDQIAGISRMGVLDERFGPASAASAAASAAAQMTNALATTERLGLLSSADPRTAATRLGAFGGPSSDAGGGIVGQLGAIESSAVAGLSPSTRDAFNGIGAVAKGHVAAFGGASLAYEQVQKQLEAGGLLTAARNAIEAAGTLGPSNPSLMSAGLLGSQAGLSTIRVGATGDLASLFDITERLSQNAIATSHLSASLPPFGRDLNALGLAGALDAASLAGFSPALRAAAAFDQSYASSSALVAAHSCCGGW
jgi:hypothetical protein